MKSLLFGFCLLSSLELLAEEPFKPSSLVLPQGVSYTLGPVTLTRVIEATTSANKTGMTASEKKSEGSSEKVTVGSSSESGSSSRYGSGSSFGGSIGGNSGGSGGFSLLGLLGINLDIGGKITSDDSTSFSSSSRNSSEQSREKSHQNMSGSSSESAEVEQYGSYHLKFTVVFKSKDLNDTFLVGGPNARVILNGFSSPVSVPYLERKEAVPLRAEERTFFFDYPITDQQMLKDAKRFVLEGRRNAVTLQLSGDDFPVVSERTKENVVSEIKRMMEKSPNTVISIDFGDVKRLSPWRVKQKYPKASGRRGERVTIREALDALNGIIAEDDEMPETAFTFARSGDLTAVCDTPAVSLPRKDNLFLIACSTVANTEEAETGVCLPTAAFLSRPLSGFTDLHLVKLSLREVAQAHAASPEKVAALVAEIEAALKNVKGGPELWKVLCAQFEKEKTEPKKEEPKSTVAADGDHKVGDEMTIDLPGGVKMTFCWCPAGEFLMGSPSTESGRDDDEQQHRVTITKGFWMGKTEVTQEQWKSVMGNNPSKFSGVNLPVERVSWDDCQTFVQGVRAKSGLDVRLPTEAEWEYACRAGSTGAYYGALTEIAWFDNNAGNRTHPVGTKMANAWGPCDMIGNVWEWCQDWYGKNYYSVSTGEDPQGPSSGYARIYRGGGWGCTAGYCRSADRGGHAPGDSNGGLGFRVSCSAGPSK